MAKLIGVINADGGELKELGLALRRAMGSHPCWLSSLTHSPTSPRASWKELEAAVQQEFGHTCATLLIRQNTPITTVSQILGHSDVQITLKTYAHFFVEDSFEAMEKLSQYVESDTESERNWLVSPNPFSAARLRFLLFARKYWGRLRESNPRPSHYE